MSYVIQCGDVMPGCPARFEGDTKDEVMGKVAQHAAAEHGITEIDDRTAAAVSGAIRRK